MCKATDIAGIIINYMNDNGYVVSYNKLQRLLYMVQGMYCAENGTRCFDDEIVKKGPGPVVAAVEAMYAGYGMNKVQAPDPTWHCPGSVPESTKSFVESVADLYGDMDSRSMMAVISRQEPWLNTERYVDCDELGRYFAKEKAINSAAERDAEEYENEY